MGFPLKIIKALILIAFVAMLAFVLSGLFPIESEGFELKDVATYFGTTDQDVVVSWDHNDPIPDGYSVKLYCVERDASFGFRHVEENIATITLPYSGHFVPMIRAWVWKDESKTERVTSSWSESTDPDVASVNGAARGWWIYGHIAPAGNITINKDP